MRLLTVFPVLVLLLLAVACATPPPPVITQRIDAIEDVNPEVVMEHDFYSANDSLYLFLKFEDLQRVLDIQAMAQLLEYTVRAGESVGDIVLLRDSVAYVKPDSVVADGSVYFNIRMPAYLAAQPNTVHVRLWQKSSDGVRKGNYFTLPLSAQMLGKDYLLRSVSSGSPLFRNYINLHEKLVLTKAGEPGPIGISLLDASFLLAAPPMTLKQEIRPKTIQVVDTSYYSSGDTLAFSKKGLYLMVSDTNTKGSRGLLVQEGSYPQVTAAQELIYPLVYITTSNERENLLQAKDAKLAVDNFWLKVAGDRTRARNLIREYYSRVEIANKRFTSHKEGWATDRGMIYVIYGKPSRINRSGNSEVWTYRESATQPYVKFVFNKKENTFTENHYELVRNRSYEENWYSTVAKWRAGITEM